MYLRYPLLPFSPEVLMRVFSCLSLIGLVAIGREMRVDLCITRLSLYP